MLNECLMFRYDHNNPMPIERLVRKTCNKMQVNTQRYGRRPYGVGLIVCGYDNAGPHVFQLCPSANYYDCKAMAIGSRSQAARTYLEKYMKDIMESDLQSLIKHAIKALKETLPAETELNEKNCQIAIVSKDSPFKLFEKDEVNKYVSTALREWAELKASIQAARISAAVPEQPQVPVVDDDQPPLVSMDEDTPGNNNEY